MNLVSYEFVTCQEKEKGVLILNKLVGPALSVGARAILVNPVNPWSITEVVPIISTKHKQPLTKRDNDPKTTVVVISGSVRPVLDQNFNEYDTWVAAENGIFLNSSEGEWVTIMPEQLNIEGGTT